MDLTPSFATSNKAAQRSGCTVMEMHNASAAWESAAKAHDPDAMREVAQSPAGVALIGADARELHEKFGAKPEVALLFLFHGIAMLNRNRDIVRAEDRRLQDGIDRLVKRLDRQHEELAAMIGELRGELGGLALKVQDAVARADRAQRTAEDERERMKQIESEASEMEDRITEAFNRATDARNALPELDELRALLEQASEFKYVGVYRTGAEYRRGNVATYGGALWHCNEDTRKPPPGGAWTLCVQRGRDGRDLRENSDE